MTKNSTIQDKMAQLEALVGWFDSEEFRLEEATTKFTEARKLADDITHDLTALKNEIDVVHERFDADQQDV